MTIELKIVGESADDIYASLMTLSRPNLATMSLDLLLSIAKTRFADAGFDIITKSRDMPAEGLPTEPPTEPSVPAKTRRTKTPAAVQPVVPAGGAAVAAPSSSTTTPEEDRAFVLDQLGTRFADPKQKTKTKAFIDRVSARFDGLRLSKLDLDVFPVIRREMEIEFGGAVVVNGGGDHAAGG